jgi:hypothetical protein
MNPYTNPIVFAYWKDDTLMGFRADTFGTISMTQPKIYNYSPEQIETVMTNTRGTLNMQDSDLMKMIEEKGYSNQPLFAFARKTENTLRSWKTFELRVHPFIQPNYDEILLKVAIDNLKPAIESRTFSIVNNEN